MSTQFLIIFLRLLSEKLTCFLQWAEGDCYPARGAINQLQRFLRQDVLAMAKTVLRFQSDIDTGKPGAKSAYKSFKTHREQHILQLESVCSSFSGQACIIWGWTSTAKFVPIGLLVCILRCIASGRKIYRKTLRGMSMSGVFLHGKASDVYCRIYARHGHTLRHIPVSLRTRRRSTFYFSFLPYSILWMIRHSVEENRKRLDPLSTGAFHSPNLWGIQKGRVPDIVAFPSDNRADPSYRTFLELA